MSIVVNRENLELWSSLGSRGAFSVAIMELGETMDDLLVVTADLSDATRVTQFREKFPDKFLNIGIAEQNMVGVAAGLAKEGKVVFATTFAAFASMRCCEQVRTDMGYMRLNVKLLGADAGVVMGTLGNTHYAVEDLSIIRAMPYLTVLSPSDGLEIIKATFAAARYEGPVYIRLTGGPGNPIVNYEDYEFSIGKAVTLRDGHDATIIATGRMVYEAVVAAESLKSSGISARVINMHTIKPLDVEVIRKACNETRLIVTAEEHSRIGGLGSAVAEFKTELENAPRQIVIGLPDSFGKIGTYKDQLERYNLTSEFIARTVELNLK